MKKSSRESPVVEHMKEVDALVAWLRGLFREFRKTYAHTRISFRVFNPRVDENGYIRFRFVLRHSDNSGVGLWGFVAVEPGNILWSQFHYGEDSSVDICRTPLPPDSHLEVSRIPGKIAAQYMALSRGPSAVDSEIEC